MQAVVKIGFLVRQLFFAAALLLITANLFAQEKDCGIPSKKQIPCLNKLDCFKEFNFLSGPPLSSKYTKVKCVKVIYSLKSKKIYFVNTQMYKLHFDFCLYYLGYDMPLFTFNFDQYGDNSNREYLLGNLNYFVESNIFVLEFFANDKISAGQVTLLYNNIAENSYFGKQLKLSVNSQEMMNKVAHVKKDIPLIYPEDIYKKQHFFALNKGEVIGKLRVIKDFEKEKEQIQPNEIIVLKELPLDIPLVKGVITQSIQTPLSHINVLCHNRKTPNASITDIFDRTDLDSLNGKWIKYKVSEQSYKLVASDLPSAQNYEKRNAISSISLQPNLNLKVNRLLGLEELSRKQIDCVGGKAAYMGELGRIKSNGKPLPLPQNLFAIPFYYYCEHIAKNGIKDSIQAILSNPSLKNNPDKLANQLKQVRKLIKNAPLDTVLLNLVLKRLGSAGVPYRFRSSTNAEDIEGFNGAGLYDSKTGIVGDTVKSIEKAIKAVWASLWNYRAFTERDLFHITQSKLAMGILVHKAFGNESANGVAITSHLYRPDYPGLTINVQTGEVSVVNPPDSVTCDQLIVGTAHINGSEELSIDYITRSSLNAGKNVLTVKEIETLSEYLVAIKDHFYKIGNKHYTIGYDSFGVDVEFKLEPLTRRIIIKQARYY